MPEVSVKVASVSRASLRGIAARLIKLRGRCLRWLGHGGVGVVVAVGACC